jgi:secreted PhoX family phosphatase
VWEYDSGRETVTLIYESTSATALQSPDNVVVVPATGDIFLQEDGNGEQFVRGVTRAGEIYDFARTTDNETEFCGGCFDPDGQTFYVNQQGDRGNLPGGPVNGGAVTYAIYGPFNKRAGSNSNHLG